MTQITLKNSIDNMQMSVLKRGYIIAGRLLI